MAKDTFYFSHDYNARNDDKIKNLIRKHGMRGYGVFWAIVEDLYNNANALRLDCEGIAYDMREDCQLVTSVIHDFGFFVIEGDTFGSISIGNRLDERNAKSKKARENAHKRWAKSSSDANALPPHSDRNAIKEVNEIKETKGEEIDVISRAQISSTHLNEFQKLSIDDCRKKYDAENVNLRNDLGAYLHIKPDEVIILHNNFDLMLKTKEPEKQYNDYTRHFSNWARKLPPDELKQKIKTTQAVFMRPEQIKVDSSKYEDYYWNPNLKKA